MNTIRHKVKALLDEGIYHQDQLFLLLYPSYPGHYARLRQIIAEVKNNA